MVLFLITFDACHSGTANRIEEYVEDDDAPIRGTNVIFFPPILSI